MMNLHNLINEIEFKLESLPNGYFLEYFERDFLPKIKEFRNKLYTKCHEQADSYPVALFQEELKKII